MKNNALKEFLIEENGNVNMAASLGKLEAALLEYQRRQIEYGKLVAQGVDQVFNTYHGANISLEAITTLSLTATGARPDTWTDLKESLTNYLNTNSGPAEQFKFGKAPGKGYWRWSDYRRNK